MVRAVRDQIAAGADVVKLYGDYRWRPGEDSRPTFSLAELNAAVEAAHDAGRTVAVHTSTPEGMRRAIAAGADTIEHGYGATPDILASMKAHGVTLCPTLAAADAVARYAGWNGRRSRHRRALRQPECLCPRAGIGRARFAPAATSASLRMATMPANSS